MELALSLGERETYPFNEPPVQLDLMPLTPVHSTQSSTMIISSFNQLGKRAVSDDEENTRKKLRLSREQSAFLEESFKEQSTLNPRQKLSLAKQLNLRPRQVEVWFQNRRARTKLKQTEVDCEYLKNCCEKLTEENKRLEKELKELRALKVSQPLYKQLPPTTLSMCPSCERVSTTTTSSKSPSNLGLSLANPKLFSFSPATS